MGILRLRMERVPLGGGPGRHHCSQPRDQYPAHCPIPSPRPTMHEEIVQNVYDGLGCSRQRDDGDDDGGDDVVVVHHDSRFAAWELAQDVFAVS